jgi:hypothetical protein
MVSGKPTYIELAKVEDEPIEFDWSEEEEESVLLDQPQLRKRLNAITYRGELAFAVAVVEWITWRLSHQLEDDEALKAIQASWAGVIDWRYLKSLDVPAWDENLDLRVGGPLSLGFRLLTETFLEARRVRPVSSNVAPLSEIPIKILPHANAYKEWRRLSIHRLTQIYPMKEADRLGPPIPRETFDHSIQYQPEMATGFIARFLKECNPKKNPYLNTPEEMIALGYQGVPYSF